MKQQVVVIHGGDPFDSYKEYIASLKSSPISLDRLEQKGWKDTLGKDLGKDFEIITPEMPNWNNAKYLEWEIYFKHLIPHLHPGAIFIGHSLGAIFLAKYFSENKYLKNAYAVFLVAAPYAQIGEKGMADFVLPKSLEKFSDQVKNIFLYQSENDPIVSFSNLKKYEKALPSAHVKIFSNKGHFILEKFPEIVKEMKALSLKK